MYRKGEQQSDHTTSLVIWICKDFTAGYFQGNKPAKQSFFLQKNSEDKYIEVIQEALEPSVVD